MTRPDPSPALRVVSQHRSVGAHVADVWSYRELLRQLVRKELTVRYKGSLLGFTWSMVQPLFLLGVYSLVFSILGAGFKNFSVWLLCGLLAWNLTNTALGTATASITTNNYLVGKVRFPRVVLPLASVGAAIIHFVLQLGVFAVVLVAMRHQVAWGYVWLIPIALVTLVIVIASLAILLSAANVFARDTQHLLEMVMLAWFWLTPIIYQYERASAWLTARGIASWLYLVNPVTAPVMAIQRAVYGRSEVDGLPLLPTDGPLWYLRNLMIVLAAALALGALALFAFDRAETRFAEVL